MGRDSESDSNGWSRTRGLVVKTLVLIGGALLLKRFTKSTTRWDHARIVARSFSGEKFSREQASRNPDSYFNIRTLTCPATEMVDGSNVLYFEQAFWRTPQKPFRQRFFMVKPCPKDLKCDVEVSSYAIRDADEYKNFCDRPRDQRPLPEEVIDFEDFSASDDIAEHLTTIYLKRCERGKRCLYEGSTPPGGFPNSWVRYSPVWGVKEGPYEFKPAPASSFNGMFSPLNFAPSQPMEKRIEGSFILQE
ncbi:chromophore lyase CRL, chloroplastic-like [Gossypium australe]|uniref:Chromophore lyase CRL, chloroplastic-like n=1 Tax=Gossypium australe TaxID=47621 RepID=A0A5B6W3A7_9ROSI|nr:chromophore lyase CRL, chloroplastic-like [Gossypium australe]